MLYRMLVFLYTVLNRREAIILKLGELIKNYRKEHQLTMAEFAKRANLSKPYISMLEKNKNSRSGKPIVPSVVTLKKVAQAMNLSFDMLLKELDANQKISLVEQEFTLTVHEDELNLIENYRSLSQKEQQTIRKACAALAKVPDLAEAIFFYASLAPIDRGVIRGEMKEMLREGNYQ